MCRAQEDRRERLTVRRVKNFSMFQYALKIAESSCVEDLGNLASIARRDFDERSTFTFRTQVPCLEYVSLLIENALLLRTNRGGRIYVGFQKLSRMEPIADRYLRIADVSERVYVFGEPDWLPPRHPHIRVIPVAGDSMLAREWFLIADSSTMRVALTAFDEDGFGVSVPEARNFSALKTSDPVAVVSLAEAAEDIVDGSLAA